MAPRSGFHVAVLTAFLLVAPSCTAAGERSDNDPLEGLNRKIFWFNLKAQKYALDPVARAWHWAVPDPAERAIARFFDNLLFPVDFVNNLLQGKPQRAVTEAARFVVNSTVGLGGLLDPATDWGIPSHPEDFGQTLAVWGFHSGPYLMIPFWGPSNVRETFGLVGDSYSSLQFLLLDQDVRTALFALGVVNSEALDLEAAAKRRAAALDYYVFVRDAYFQRRQAMIRDSATTPAGETEDLYEIDFDDE